LKFFKKDGNEGDSQDDTNISKFEKMKKAAGEQSLNELDVVIALKTLYPDIFDDLGGEQATNVRNKLKKPILTSQKATSLVNIPRIKKTVDARIKERI